MTDKPPVSCGRVPGGLGGAGGFATSPPRPSTTVGVLRRLAGERDAKERPGRALRPLSPVRPAHSGALAVLALVDGLIVRSTVFGDPGREGRHDHRSMPIVLDAGNDGIAFEDDIAEGGRQHDLDWDWHGPCRVDPCAAVPVLRRWAGDGRTWGGGVHGRDE